jgi:hypothetical protein
VGTVIDAPLTIIAAVPMVVAARLARILQVHQHHLTLYRRLTLVMEDFASTRIHSYAVARDTFSAPQVKCIYMSLAVQAPVAFNLQTMSRYTADKLGSPYINCMERGMGRKEILLKDSPRIL